MPCEYCEAKARRRTPVAYLLKANGTDRARQPSARPIPAPDRGLLAPFQDFRAVALTPGLLVIALVLFMAQASRTAPAPVLSLLVPHLSGLPATHGIPQTAPAVGLILDVSGLCAASAAWYRVWWNATAIGARSTICLGSSGAPLGSHVQPWYGVPNAAGVRHQMQGIRLAPDRYMPGGAR